VQKVGLVFDRAGVRLSSRKRRRTHKPLQMPQLSQSGDWTSARQGWERLASVRLYCSESSLWAANALRWEIWCSKP